jgi:hypothetical protein
MHFRRELRERSEPDWRQLRLPLVESFPFNVQRSTSASEFQLSVFSFQLLLKEFFGAIEETFPKRGVFFTAHIGEFLEFLALESVELGRDFHDHANEQIAVAAAVDVNHAFAAKLEHLPGLRPGRDFHTGFAVERRHRNFAA